MIGAVARSPSRRALVLGAGALALCLAAGPGPAAAAAGSRRLALTRAGDEIGAKTVTVRREGDTVEVETRIDIAVTVLGLSVFRYRLAARETWARGALQRLRAETDDNGAAHVAEADREGGRLMVRGSVWRGEAPGLAATTSYWSPAFLERPVWISTQDGRLLNVRARNRGQVAFPVAGGAIEATRWEISGDLTGLFLYYDAAGEWVGTEFPARGATARFAVAARGGALTPLWVNA
jgi:hypothetical protein